MTGAAVEAVFELRQRRVSLADGRVQVQDDQGRRVAWPWQDITGARLTAPAWYRRGSVRLTTRTGQSHVIPLRRGDTAAAAAFVDRLPGAGRPAATADDLLAWPSPDGRTRLDRFAVVDLETTGLSPSRGDRIVEVAIVTVEHGRITDSWSTLVNPGRDTGPAHIHRITNPMVVGAPHLRDVAADIEERLGGAVLVAHHAPFEGRFLFHGFTGIGRPLPVLPALDTLRLSRDVARALSNHRLATVARWAGVEPQDAHTALGDATATAQALPVLLDRADLDLAWQAPTAPRIPAPGPSRAMPRRHPARLVAVQDEAAEPAT